MFQIPGERNSCRPGKRIMPDLGIRYKGRMNMLKIEHLTKIYSDTKAVDDLSLHIQPGEIYGFIGHNGAGKTTTLKSVAGILNFNEGEIFIDGKSIKKQPQKVCGHDK